MTIKNGDLPAMPITNEQAQDADMHGLSKREMFCLHMCVAETGDAELDEIIRKGNRQKMAIAAMHSFMAAPMGKFNHDNAGDAMRDAIVISGALLAELERTK